MEIIRNDEKCTKCMRCVRDCIGAVWRDVEGVPTPVAPDLCNLCSHCLSVCPEGAIEHRGLDAQQVREIKKKLINAEYYREVVMGRRSVREFRKKAIPREVLEDILDLARFSPTASNHQDVAYTVVTDPDILTRISKRIFNMGLKANVYLKKRSGKFLLKTFGKTNLAQSLGRYMDQIDYYEEKYRAGKDYILHNAPALILIHAPKKASFECDNCNIAATNITNYAHSLGLGSCYIGFVTMTLRYDRGLNRILKIPTGQRVFASVVLGYPAYPHTNTVSRKTPEIQWL